MEIVNNENPNKVKYFDLREYISRIKLNSNVLEHIVWIIDMEPQFEVD